MTWQKWFHICMARSTLHRSHWRAPFRSFHSLGLVYCSAYSYCCAVAVRVLISLFKISLREFPCGIFANCPVSVLVGFSISCFL